MNEEAAVEKKPEVAPPVKINIKDTVELPDLKKTEMPRKFSDSKDEAKKKAEERERKRIERIAVGYSKNALASQLKTAKGYYKKCLQAEVKRREAKK